jgi:spermidine/putrescine transport system ATP-binding protein
VDGDRVRLEDGTEVQVPHDALSGRTGKVQIGIRPEKLRIGEGGNTLSGVVTESAYIGVSTQYVVDTPAGSVTVYVQNDRPGANGVSPGERLTLGWSPESTFVVDVQEAL